MEKKYKNQIDTLMLQLDKVKNGLEVAVNPKEEEAKK